jgi:hypothetical protein
MLFLGDLIFTAKPFLKKTNRMTIPMIFQNANRGQKKPAIEAGFKGLK